jgi:hypothetical protein
MPFLIKAKMQESTGGETDVVSGVGGKHLAPKSALDYLKSFLTLTLVSGILAFGGLMTLRIADLGVIMPDLPFLPQVQVSVVDGTNTGLADGVRTDLVEAGWNIVSTSSLSDIDPGSPTAVNTLVFITEEGYRDEAEALSRKFPGAIISVSDQFPDPVTVVIGMDFLD